MDRIADFYLGKDVHPDGFTIDQIWGWDDQQLEYEHTYIQWLFPSHFPSQAVPGSPVISAEETKRFRMEPELRNRFLRSYHLMLDFYGFQAEEEKVVRANDYSEKIQNWLTPSNHNFLRITRILKCLMLFEFANDAKAFYKALLQVHRESPMIVGDQTQGYWRRACIA